MSCFCGQTMCNNTISIIFGTMIEPGLYEHYKGKTYEVVGVAHHSESLESMVVYRALYHSPDFGFGALWVRPLAMFKEEINVEGKMVPRFKKIEKI